MNTSTHNELTKWVRAVYRKFPDRVLIRTKHIEKDNIWRDITEADVRRVLLNGKVTKIRQSDKSIFWRGTDSDGRLLELQLGLMNRDGEDILIVEEAIKCRVGTAYDPAQDDASVKKVWLNDHPDYEMLPDGKIKKKIKIFKV